MFHCNGWCFTWAVTAVGGTPRLPAQGRAGADLGAARRRGRHPLQRRADRADRLVNDPKAHALDAPGHGHGGRRAALAHPARAGSRSSNFRPVHVYGLTETYGPHTVCALARGVGRRCPPTSRRAWPPARARATPSSDLGARGRRRDERRAARRRDAGRGGDARQQRDEGLLRAARGDGRGLPRRLVPLRRHRRHGIPTATSSCATARRTSSSRAARTSRPSRSSSAWPAIRRCWSARWSRSPTRSGASGPKAFVTLKPGAEATEREIIEFCREHIAHFKCPAAVEFGELPKTSTGKIQKFVLREKEWAGREKRIN